MRDRLKSLVLLLSLSLLAFTTFAQTTTVTGSVNNKTSKESLGAVSVTVKGGTSGTFTDDKGKFKLTTNQKPPFTLVISSVGFADQEVQVNGSQSIAVNLEPYYALGSDIVVAASRVPERILESPVSIERINNAQIVTAPTNSYYDILRTIPGVDITTSSLTFETPSTRGFNGSGNVRLNQIVDGMDNQAPGLNFSVGSVIGLTDLDVDNMELLEGASSALYGPGGMNGALIINSKDPYKYQGLSAEVKEGVMNLGNSARSASVYNDYTVRWAQKIGDKFAFKLSGEYIEGDDWLANDSSDYNINANNGHGGIVSGTRASDPNYNGVNVYGDETSQNLSGIASQVFAGIDAAGGSAGLAYANSLITPGTTLAQFTQELTQSAQVNPALSALLPYAPIIYGANSNVNYFTNNNVSRTGYKEQDVVNPITKDIKLSAGLYYKFTDQMTLSLTGNYGTGNTVYTGADRYVLNDLQMGQYKIELKSKNWFIRGYTTQENSGNAYNATVNTQLLNEAWGGGSPTWYPTYMTAYTEFLSAGENATQAANSARAIADAGRPAPGSALYTHLADSIAKLPIPAGGHFLDRTDLYVGEAQYNLTEALGLKTKGTDVLVGADYKQYELNSQGTLFADTAGKIGISEVGVYGQVSQKFFHDVLKLSVSGRYDKNQNFDGKFTPRATAVITIAKNQNIRLSYQEAYRFPTTQNQWINLNTGEGILIGGLPQLRDFYGLNPGDKNYNPGYTPESVQAFGASAEAGTPNPGLLVVQKFGPFTPETCNSFEAGYKGLVANGKLLIDVSGYYSQYKNLLTRVSVVQADDGNPANLLNGEYQGISVSVNYTNPINTYGYGASLQYLLRHNFYLTANASSDNISNASQVYSPTSPFVSYYNTPKYRSNVGIGNSGFGFQKRLGFNLIWHWQDKFYEQADFINGYVNAYSSLDADISYKVTGIKSVIKLGATNLLNHYYLTAPGNPYIGGMYFISFAYNVL
jgi:outer membrane cobalamin receptor